MSAEISIETPTAAPAAPESLLVGPYILYPDSCIVHFVESSARVFLTQFEMTLLAHLARRVGTIISKEELTRLMYGQRRPESNGLEVFVGRIRRKIDPEGTYKPLQTVRYSGYRFRNDWEQTT